MSISTHWQLARAAAERYERVVVPAILGPFAQALVAWATLHSSETVVDVGCGTGAAARYAAEQVGPSGRVIGVDVNAGMIAVAKSLPPVQSVLIEWHESSASQLPLNDQMADVVLCAQTLQFLHDRRQALSEMDRVLKPGGRIAVSLWCDLCENPYFHALVEAISYHIGPDTAVGLQAAFALTYEDEIRTLFAEGDFKNVDLTVAQLDLELPELKEFVPRHIGATPMAAGFNAASQAVQMAAITDVAERLVSFQTDNTVRIPFRSYLVRAGK